MPKRSAKAMMKAIPPSTSSSQQPEKRTLRSTEPRILYIDNLLIEMLDKILRELGTIEQCKLRRVCHFWKNCIEKMFAITRMLKLNLMWAPAVSLQSMQFDSNWTEPEMESYKKASFTVPSPYFSVKCINLLGRFFSQVNYLVVHFDLVEDQKNFDNFISLMENFNVLQSFSLIRAETLYNEQFIPTLCDTLERFRLRRLDLYIEQKQHFQMEKHKIAITMAKSLEHLENFALSFWPEVITWQDQKAILENVGVLLKNEGNVTTDKSTKLTSLCIPTYSDDMSWFERRAQLQNVKHLQLTELRKDCFSSDVSKTLELCPQLQSLELYYASMSYKKSIIQLNSCIELINKNCKHLSELKLFNGMLPLYEEGPKAPCIRKLTIAAGGQFDHFKDVFEEKYIARRLAWYDTPMRAPKLMLCPWEGKIVNEFVKLITLKFPCLEELTILTDEDTDEISRKCWKNFKTMIINELRVHYEKLIINIELWNPVCDQWNDD